MKKASWQLPLNSVSFGAVSTAILRELYARGLTPPIFPIGPIDLGSQTNLTPEFHSWLNHCKDTSQQKHSRKDPVFRLWHISSSLESLSNLGNRLITFNELDSLTPLETNVLSQQEKVFVTSNYTKSVFKMLGIESEYLPLGFDHANFKQITDKELKIKGEVSALISGKFEVRKSHPKILNAWAKRYGNKQGYKLNVAVHNHFFGQTFEQAAAATWQAVHQALEGKTYWNINPVQYSPSNAAFNETLQSSNIYIAMSGGEGRDLPAYHAVGMGAHCVGLKAHAYLDYLNDDNAVLVSPNSKRPCYDNVFFREGESINQGNVFDFDVDDFYAAFDKAVERVKANPINVEGLKLQSLTYKDTVDVLLKDL